MRAGVGAVVGLWLAGLAAGGCAPETYSQTGSASVTFKGLICIGCNATTRNSIVPSADDAVALALLILAAVIVLAFWYGYLRLRSG